MQMLACLRSHNRTMLQAGMVRVASVKGHHAQQASQVTYKGHTRTNQVMTNQQLITRRNNQRSPFPC